MKGWIQSKDKLSAEFLLTGKWFRQRVTIVLNQPDPLFSGLTEFSVDFGLIASVNCPRKQLGATASKAFVFIASFDVFHIRPCLFLDLFAIHKQNHSFTASNARLTSRSW